jgi:HIP---CoA ligase
VRVESPDERAMHAPATIPTLLDWAAETHGDADYLVEGHVRHTFREVRSLARRAAAAFIASGVKQGDRIAIWAPNSTEWVIACLGLHYVGAVLVPVNTRYRGEEAAYVIAKSRAVGLVTTTDFLGTDYVSLLRESRTALPHLAHVIVVSGSTSAGAVSWADFLERGRRVEDSVVDRRAASVAPDDLCDVMFTSGTTGAPKGVMLDHGQTTQIIAIWNAMLGLSTGDRYLVVNPFFHVFGYKYGWLCSLLGGVTVYPMAVFEPGDLLELVERERITILPGQPTVFRGLMDRPEVSERDLSSLRLAVIGSTSIPPQIVRDMHDVLGFTYVVSGYGLTETTGEVTLCRFGDDIETVATTVGKPIDGVELRVVDASNAEVVGGQQGEVVVRGFNVMRGYFEDPQGTAAVIDDQGWLHTGDLGWVDGSGSLRLTGRLKDMFIVGGFNVAPPEVEAMLLSHPAVSEAAVVGVPDARLGEVGVAFVVVRDGASVDEPELISWCRTRIANFKVPRRVVLCDALPYNAVGKVQKQDLRQRLMG